MKDKVELRFVHSEATSFKELAQDPGSWELIVNNDLYGNIAVALPSDIAMTVAVAIATARDAGRKEGYDKAKKKYKAINKVAGSMTDVFSKPWDNADIPMHWNPQWKLNDPRQ